jgi:signal transduction histidine kinase
LEESHARLDALNREKDVMFGVAAHDLRGPLAVIMGFAENLLGRAEASGVAQHSVEVILREARQMEHFLGTLLDLEALERGGSGLKLHAIDLGAAARLAVERSGPAAERKSLTLHLAVGEGSAMVRADGAAVRRVLDNLLSNAIKFTPSGGRVTVRVTESGEDVLCAVSDSGPGLTPEDCERAFTRFARLSARPTAGEKSTGLGLAICRALVARMSGRVWCGNNPEGGAIFSMALPASMVSAPPAPFGSAVSVSPFPHLMVGREPR